jgi:parvulin-like peptidyl-prolyl isomerase
MKRIAAAVMLVCLGAQAPATALAQSHGTPAAPPPVGTPRLKLPPTVSRVVAARRAWVYPPGNSPLAADVDGRPITRFMVIQTYGRMRDRGEEIPPDSAGVWGLLQGMVDKALLGWAAQDRGYHLTPQESAAYEKQRLRLMRDYLHTLQQARAPQVNEDQVRALYEQQRRLFACHRLGVYREALADSLAGLLRAGADFESLAAKFNRDSGTRATLGQVQEAWTVGFTPAYVESALVKLRPGQTAGPLRSPDSGIYHLVRLDSIVTRDLEPFETARDALARTLSANVVRGVRDSMFQAFLAKADPRFRDSTLALVTARFDSAARAARAADTSSVQTVELNPRMPAFSPAERRLTLLDSNYGPLTLDDLVTDLRSTTSFFRPKLQTEEEVRRYARIKACEPAMTEAAVQARLDTLSLVARDLFDDRDRILVERFMRTEVESRAPATDDTARAYFEAHRSDFDFPETVTPRMIAVEDSALADSLYRVLETGKADFGKLVDQFSTDLETRDAGGETGPVVRGYSRRDTTWENVVFAMQPGMRSRPFRVGFAWVLVEVTARNPRHHRTWEQARKYVHQTVSNLRQERMVQALLKAARLRHPPKLYPEVIRTINVMRPLDWSER